MFSGSTSAISSCKPGCPGNRGEMAQGRADTPPLVPVDHGESHLGLAGLHDDVTPAGDDHRPPIFFQHCDQGDVVDEVDVEKERDLSLAEVAFCAEETAVEGLVAGAADRRDSPSRSSGFSARISTRRPSQRFNRRILDAPDMAGNVERCFG